MMLRSITRRQFSTRCFVLNSVKGENGIRQNRYPLDKVVYMSDLPYSVTRETIEKVFERYGPIEELHIPKTAGKEHAKGYGRIVFADKQNARRASIQMQGYVIENRPIKLELGTEAKKKENMSYDVVMLNNLPYDADEEELMKILRPYQALRIGLPRSPIKKDCLGYGFVRFATTTAASNAISKLKNLKLNGRKVRLNLAEPRDHHYQHIV